MTKRKYSLKEKMKYARKLRQEMTPAELKLWVELKQCKEFKFMPQAVVCGYIPDFVAPTIRLIVEVDGPVHKFTRGKDKSRTNNLQRKGYTVLRFENHVVLTNPRAVMVKILQVAYSLRYSLVSLPTRRRRKNTSPVYNQNRKSV